MNTKLKNSNKKARIFVVDDHPILRQGLIQLINQEEDMISVGEAGNAVEAKVGITKTKPDLIIMDLSLKGTSGLELTKLILAKQAKVLILIVSMYDESVYIERVLKAGAKGYLTKRENGAYRRSEKPKVIPHPTILPAPIVSLPYFF